MLRPLFFFLQILSLLMDLDRHSKVYWWTCNTTNTVCSSSDRYSKVYWWTCNTTNTGHSSFHRYSSLLVDLERYSKPLFFFSQLFSLLVDLDRYSKSTGGPRQILKATLLFTTIQSIGGPRHILKVYWWTYNTTIISCSCSDRYSKRSSGGPRQILKVYWWT